MELSQRGNNIYRLELHFNVKSENFADSRELAALKQPRTLPMYGKKMTNKDLNTNT